jgi:hypothetical protein
MPTDPRSLPSTSKDRSRRRLPFFVLLIVTLTAACGGRAPSPAASASVSADPGRFARSGLVFDHPAAWHAYRPDGHGGAGSVVLGYITSFDLTTHCGAVPLPECLGPSFAPPAGTAGVIIEEVGRLWTDEPEAATSTVGGLPARAVPPVPPPGQDEWRQTWEFARPLSVESGYRLTGWAREPNVDTARAAFEALVASVRFEPPLRPLPEGSEEAKQALQRALTAATSRNEAYACLPANGGSASATLETDPLGAPLRAPVTVTCAITIEATRFELWEVSVMFEWDARSEHRAGQWRETWWLSPAGETVATRIGGDPFPGS